MEENEYASAVYSNVYTSDIDFNEKIFSKQPLSLNDPKNGVIATIHHTVRRMDDGELLRFALKKCCFNVSSSQLVSIDTKGNVFVVDFDRQRYWKHSETISDVSALIPSITEVNCYLAGTEKGYLMQLNVEKSYVQYVHLSQESIDEISFPGLPKKLNNVALIRTGNVAKIIDLLNLTCTHRLQFNELKMSLKFANYLPNSEQIITGFMDNSVHIWSTISLDVIRIINPIKIRDKRLKLLKANATHAANLNENNIASKVSFISLNNINEMSNKPSTTSLIWKDSMENNQMEFSGSILSYCYPNDGSLLCFSTNDNYLMLINPYTFELIYLIYLQEFNLQQCALMSKPNDGLIFGLTKDDHKVILLDYHNGEHKILVDAGPCQYIQLSGNDKILAIVRNSGELKLWSVPYLIKLLRDQQSRMKRFLKSASTKKKIPTPISNFMTTDNFNENHYTIDGNLMLELRKLLQPKRLQQILNEYLYFPEKYRALIWCTLLKLPYNQQQYQDLVNMGVPPIVQQKCMKYPLKDQRMRKCLTTCWSNLAQWCKIFAYNDAIPHLIFPFVKIFHLNSMVAFEVCSTLIMNHFQLFFEFHPLEPSNYLAMCTNLLQYFDPKLFDFYASRNITASTYAWIILQNVFSEVLDEEQWLCLWDNLLLAPIYQLIFYVVAYNQLQREIILRLPYDSNGRIIEQFFHEQNPIDVRKLIQHVQQLSAKCPNALHPRRYFGKFQSIPNGVYPKFLRYPMKNLAKYEKDMNELTAIQTEIDNRIRELDVEERKALQRLEGGLQREEHTRRMKNIENHYQSILKREEERLNCQRKMLLLYEKEIRHRKREALNIANESRDRKNLLRYQRQFEKLKCLIERERLHSDTNLACAEELFHHEDIELKTLKSKEQQDTNYQNLSSKYGKKINKVFSQYNIIKDDLKKMETSNKAEVGKKLNEEHSHCTDTYLDLVENTLNNLENEWCKLMEE